MNARHYKQPPPFVHALDLGLVHDFRQRQGWVTEHEWLQSDAIGQNSGFCERTEQEYCVI